MAKPYFIIEFIKDKVDIELDNQDHDPELIGLGNEADEWIDDNLRDVIGLVLPLDTVPVTIKKIASMYAAGLWQMKNSGDPSKTPAYIRQAEKNIATYKANYNISDSVDVKCETV